MKTVKTQKALQEAIRALRAQGKTIALVPTMGALHKGHAALMRTARRYADAIVVYIFVNPLQFAPHEDFNRYPRPFRQDAALCRAEHVDVLYAPSVSDVYPPGYRTVISVREISEGLDGAHRPGHFDGVATVLAKMFIRVLPDTVFMGEKDYQQLLVVKKLARDLDLPVKVIGVPTQRERDGLARSSRNRYLSAKERTVAKELYAQMRMAAKAIQQGGDIAKTLQAGRKALLKAGFKKVDYFDLRDADTFMPLKTLKKPARLLAAAYLGTTRLIDNIPV